MVVEDLDDAGLVLIDQEAHARLTGDLAAALPSRVSHHAAFVAAARLHDNGWREADRDISVDGEGRPHTFTSVPDDVYEELWRRGIRRAADVDPLVGLLVGLHGARFFGTRESPGMRRLVEEERRRQAAVLGALHLDGDPVDLPRPLAAASDSIAVLDALSLLLCGAGLPDQIAPAIGGTRYTLTRTARGTVTVDPWPYDDGTLTFAVDARQLGAGPYPSGAALRAAIADTEAHTRTVSVTAAR